MKVEGQNKVIIKLYDDEIIYFKRLWIDCIDLSEEKIPKRLKERIGMIEFHNKLAKEFI